MEETREVEGGGGVEGWGEEGVGVCVVLCEEQPCALPSFLSLFPRTKNDSNSPEKQKRKKRVTKEKKKKKKKKKHFTWKYPGATRTSAQEKGEEEEEGKPRNSLLYFAFGLRLFLLLFSLVSYCILSLPSLRF